MLRATHRVPSEKGVRLISRFDRALQSAWKTGRPPCFVADNIALRAKAEGLAMRDPENPQRGEVYESRAGTRWEVTSVNAIKRRIKVKKAGFRDLGELEWNPSVLRQMKQLQTRVAAQIRHDEGPSIPSQEENPGAFKRWLEAFKASRRQFPPTQGDPERRYYVYVIRSIRNGKHVLYVGQSAHPPSVRLKQHLHGARYCKGCTKRSYVKGTSMKLMPQFYKGIPPIRSRKRAEQVERILARKLRSLGFTVEGGH